MIRLLKKLFKETTQVNSLSRGSRRRKGGKKEKLTVINRLKSRKVFCLEFDK